jgi:pimeloyl-ACP methyl ester carboxylesterase
MAEYDAPAFIDYVLKETKLEKISWIGHSQGTT